MSLDTVIKKGPSDKVVTEQRLEGIKKVSHKKKKKSEPCNHLNEQHFGDNLQNMFKKHIIIFNNSLKFNYMGIP